MSCADCGFVPEPFQAWGFLLDANPVWSCDHSGTKCRYCDSCSAYWHRPDMEEDDSDGQIKREDCPDCVAFDAENDNADLETKLAAAMEE